MYRYDEFDESFVRNRVADFRNQIERRLSGALTEEEFKPLRLQNGLYLQLHAYMLRVAVPYGTLSSRQMRQLAYIAERWDRGYGHLTTRQNIQFNWPKLREVPEILDSLADVEMHAIQTSGNCIRNVTADHFAGAVADEIEDPRITAEIIRQWSTDHPEFGYLPRKFKIAVNASTEDRAVIRAHDIGIQLVRDHNNKPAYDIYVGGGLGRTPVVGQRIFNSLPAPLLLSYLEAILRVYNLSGRRDNKYKARIKILVKAMGIEAFTESVNAEFSRLTDSKNQPAQTVSPALIDRLNQYFKEPSWNTDPFDHGLLPMKRNQNPEFDRWYRRNLSPHRQPNYRIVTVSIKPVGGTPGDITSEQMRVIADLAAQFGHDEIRISHEQNIILPHVHESDLPSLYDALISNELATANVGLISDIIACPGMDYCSLATARSIPIAQDIAKHFGNDEQEESIGPLKVKISGCINACAHHHLGHIGILGLEKGGKENYQFTFGGDHTETCTIGERAGPGIDADEVVPAMKRIMETYLQNRQTDSENFLDTYRRIGAAPFKNALFNRAESNATATAHE